MAYKTLPSAQNAIFHPTWGLGTFSWVFGHHSDYLGTFLGVFRYKKSQKSDYKKGTFKRLGHTHPLQNASGTHTGPLKAVKTIYFHPGTPPDVDWGVFRVFRRIFV